MELQQLLKKDSLSNTELQEMLYRINNETSYNENRIDLYNNAIHQASKLGIGELYKLYKDIEKYGISDEDKKLLQGNITFYIGELKNMSKENIQQMLYFINTERITDENKIKLYNKAIFEASKFGIEILYKIYKEIEQYGISDEDKKLLQGNITFYIGELKNMSKENIQQMLYFINTERITDENKIKLYNKAIFEASKFGISFLYKIYKEIEQYDITDEEKKLLQGNVTFYMLKQENVSLEDIQIMMYFMKTEKQNAEDKINLLNQIIYMASTVGLNALNKLYSELINQNLNEEEMRLLEGNIKFYASRIEEKMNLESNDLSAPKHK